MDINQAKTFLAITATGSFAEAAKQLCLTQSTISARIKRLEEELGVYLFFRNRSGAILTPAGNQFVPYAKRLALTADQARDMIGLHDRYHAIVRIGARIALWEGILPMWVGWLRQKTDKIVIHSVIGFEEDLMQHLIEGTLDIGLMYTPRHSPGVIVEHVFDEKLVFVTTHEGEEKPGDDYVYVQWGHEFHTQHAQTFPDLEQPGQIVNIGWLAIQLVLNNGGSCYLPSRLAEPYIQSGKLYAPPSTPEYLQPAYLVYSRESESPVLEQCLTGLRHQLQHYTGKTS
ncbi:MAG: LysR family transcriptional regulator [Gammaproteobacteria bacterium]|nr:LysR family transcriptional regulator [Gammaproteobacteria bacterium]MDH5800018.1 LysR family transcriptional regulator [Gammaproteobacteria bacterium]